MLKPTADPADIWCMAEKTAAEISAIAHLEEALAHPEPMCLAVLELCLPTSDEGERTGVAGAASCDAELLVEVMEEAQRRLRDTLRDYDELSVIDECRYALVLRTLADAAVMKGRMEKLHGIMSEPYRVDGRELVVSVHLGSAIRIPQESPVELVDRVESAVDDARHPQSPGHVML